MTKEELAKIEAKKVRSDTSLFALFRKYVTEDAGLIYSTGKLPQGCFGCQFNSLFSKWQKLYQSPLNTIKMANSEKKTYELENNATRIFFKGSVLSSNSSDEQWLEWLNHPADVSKRESRQKYFKKLPRAQDEQVDDAPKKTRKRTKKVEETEVPEENTQ